MKKTLPIVFLLAAAFAAFFYFQPKDSSEAVTVPVTGGGYESKELTLHIGELKDAAQDVPEEQSVLVFSLTGYPVEATAGQEIVHYPIVKVFPVREGATELSFIADLSTTNFGKLYLGDYIQEGTIVEVDGVEYVVKADNVLFGQMGVEIKLTPQ